MGPGKKGVCSSGLAFSHNANSQFLTFLQLLGLRSPEWTKIVIEELGISDLEPGTLAKEWEENLNQLCSQVKKIDGAMELIEYFASMGIKQGIATSR